MDNTVKWKEAEGFENLGVLALEYKGEICFVVRELGKEFGYGSDGRSFKNVITSIWNKTIITGKHLFRVEDDELDSLKEYVTDILALGGSKHTSEEGVEIKNDVEKLTEYANTCSDESLESPELDVSFNVHPNTSSLLLITTEGLAIAAELSQKAKAKRFNEHVQLLLEKKELGMTQAGNFAISQERFIDTFNTLMEKASYIHKIETGEAIENAVNELIDRYREEFEPEPPRGKVATELLRLKNHNKWLDANYANDKLVYKIAKEADVFKVKGALVLKNLAEEVASKLEEWENLLRRAYIADNNRLIDWEITNCMAGEKQHQEKAIWFKTQESRVLSEFMESRDRYIAAFELIEDQVYCAALGYQDPAKPTMTPEELEKVERPYRRCWTRTEESKALWETIDAEMEFRTAITKRKGQTLIKRLNETGKIDPQKPDPNNSFD